MRRTAAATLPFDIQARALILVGNRAMVSWDCRYDPPCNGGGALMDHRSNAKEIP